MQAEGRSAEAYALASRVAGQGGPVTPYAQHVMLEIARPGASEATNRQMAEMADRVMRWKPDSFICYHAARWLASVGEHNAALRQLERTRQVYPGTFPAFVRDMAASYPRDSQMLRGFANEVFARCDAGCREKAGVNF